jgi:two-component sensor histidine kinase
LPSRAVQTFALALHELATNATKYGAWASTEGHLDVSWALAGEAEGRWLTVEWKESGVRTMPNPNDAPRGGGYGRELIERALPYQLGARTQYRLEADGVRCSIELPVASDTAPDGGLA